MPNLENVGASGSWWRRSTLKGRIIAAVLYPPFSNVMLFLPWIALASGLGPRLTGARPTVEQSVFQTSEPKLGAKPRPLVIWSAPPRRASTMKLISRHGLGDTAHAEGIEGFIEDIKEAHPGIYVHSVQIPEGGSLDDERKAGFVGHHTESQREKRRLTGSLG